MKKLSLIAAFCAAGFAVDAAILRVNNNTGISANYTDVQAAISAAAAGDTILVEPSATGYSGITLNKRLVILGNGYFNNANVNGGLHTMNAGLQANDKNSVLGSITFDLGSGHSVVMGLVANAVWIYESDITVKRCWVGHFYLNNSNTSGGNYGNRDSINISQNVITGNLQTYYFSASGGIGITDVNIQNNIFHASNYVYVSLPVGVQGYFQNNIYDNWYGAISMWGFQIANNIIVNGGFTANNSVYFNNISTGTQFGTANSNQQNVAATTIFSNYNGSGQTETRYYLNPSGPAVGAGFNGVDIGAFGGPDPYKLSGIPPIPSIYSLSAPATTTTNTLQVTISTRSNN